MGQPTNFDGSNTVMRAPEGAENVQDMHVFRTRHSCVSCWEVSTDELAEISRTGRIFLSVLMGGQQPPVYVGSESSCREVLVDFGPVWPLAPRTPSPSQHVEPAAPKLFGPYGHLNGPRFLDEGSWAVEWDPIENNDEYFSIPLYSLVEPVFPVTVGAAEGDADSQPPVQHAAGCDPALLGIAEEMKESGGHWQPCTGCYDTEDGHPTQKYEFSPALQTSIGCGCHECGGLGAVWWHMTDEEIADFERISQEVDTEHELSMRIVRLEAALRPFAQIADQEERAGPIDSVMVNVARCREARATLADKRGIPPVQHVALPTVERLADMIDDAAPGILRPDTRLRIASHLRAALASSEGRNDGR